MKKVLIISGSLPPIKCGVGYYTHRLAEKLAAADSRQLDLAVLSTSMVNTDLPVDTLTVNNWKIASIPKMLKAIATSRAEIVHIQYPAVGYKRNLGINLLPYVLRFFKPQLRLLITLHEYHESRLIGRWRNLITVLPAHRIIVSNQIDKDDLGRRLKRKIAVVPIGANFDRVKKNPATYKKIMDNSKLEPSKKTLLFFGFAERNKKLEVLIEALDRPTLRDYQLLLLTGLDHKRTYHQMLIAKIQKLNKPRPRVGITGFLEDAEVSAILQEGRYFVLPQTKPISPKSSTAITAIQHGLVLISHSGSRVEDTRPFTHLKNCYLLENASGSAIASAIAHLEKSPAEVHDIRNGMIDLKQYFSWSNIVDKHIKVYKEL